MKRLFVTMLVVLAALVVLAPATAAPPTNAQLAARLKALEARNARLEKKVQKLEKDLDSVGGLAATSLVFSVCGFSQTADALQGTWNVIDQISVATPGIARTFFGTQVPVVDPLNSCTLLRLTRVQTVPPTVAPFSALLGLLRSSSFGGIRP